MGSSPSIYEQKYNEFQTACATGSYDFSTGMYCMDALRRNNVNDAEIMLAEGWNKHRLYGYGNCMDKMTAKCGKYAEDAVPMMYKPYNTVDPVDKIAWGKNAVEDWIAKRPDAPAACKDLLRNNWLNPEYRCWNPPYTILKQAPADLLSSYNRGLLAVGDYDFQAGLNFASPVYGGQRSIAVGAPWWNSQERTAKFMLMGYGVDNAGVVQSAEQEILTNAIQYGRAPEGTQLIDYFQETGNYIAGGEMITAPGYKGKLPNLPQPAVAGNIPWVPTKLEGGAGDDYVDPCQARGPLETILPIAASIAGILAPLVVIPLVGIAPLDDAGVWTAAGTLGGTMYYLARDVYGVDAVLGLTDENGKSPSFYSARILGVGAPVSAWLLADTMGVLASIGSGQAFRYGGAIAAGTVGFLLLVPVLESALGFGGSLLSIISAPIAFLETGITLLFNGCVAQEINGINKCKCREAYSKSNHIRDFALMYGITDNQKTLRSACARAAMTAQDSMWGSSRDVIGKCDLDTGVMDKYEACISSAQWLYRPNDSPNMPAMWAEVAHCYDAKNPSFLPPKTDADKQCQTKYGEYYRDVGGQCLNKAAPVNLQTPDAFDFENFVSMGGADQGWCNIL